LIHFKLNFRKKSKLFLHFFVVKLFPNFLSEMQNFFQQADISKDGLLSFEEVRKFLRKKQLVLPKEKLLELIKVSIFLIALFKCMYILLVIINIRKLIRIKMDTSTKKNLQI
jgi:hypothetical protein